MPSHAATFTADTIAFLSELKANNNRDWFQANKPRYESAIKAPLLAFASALSDHIATVTPEYATAPEKAVQRIYRDIRFSPDKTPYRTELGILFTHRGLGKDSGSGIYISLASDAVRVAGGLYQQDPKGLYAVRQHLVDHMLEFQRLVKDKALRKTFGEVTGNALKRPPRGFAPDHPSIDLLKQTQWLLHSQLSPETMLQPSFLTVIWSQIQILLPFVRFFESPLLKAKAPAFID